MSQEAVFPTVTKTITKSDNEKAKVWLNRLEGVT